MWCSHSAIRTVHFNGSTSTKGQQWGVASYVESNGEAHTGNYSIGIGKLCFKLEINTVFTTVRLVDLLYEEVALGTFMYVISMVLRTHELPPQQGAKKKLGTSWHAVLHQ